MRRKKNWITYSIFNLCVVAFIGFILRSKIIFTLPIINYNHLLESHFHFAFGGWVTLALMVLSVYELLPASVHEKPFYQWIFGVISISSWITLLTQFFGGNSLSTKLFSAAFILATYVYGFRFIRDIKKANVSKSVLVLVVSSIVSLMLSSVGPFALDYLFAVKSQNAVLYRNALYTYLHFQYNGFFTLAVFSLIFHKIKSEFIPGSDHNIHTFSILLIISIPTSLFLTYLWHDPNSLFRAIAICGSVFIFLTLVLFLIISSSLFNAFHKSEPVLKYVMFLSFSSFVLKMFLQSFTIFPKIGDAVFGNRPIIIGFLHLVFLAFVTLFILGYLFYSHLQDIRSGFTTMALIIFSSGVILTEAILMAQGLGAMFLKSNSLVPWLLWTTSILLFIGALMIFMARIIPGPQIRD